MKDPQHISEVIIKIASDPTDSVGKVICQCPCVKELLRRKIISLDDLSDDQIKRLSDNAFLEDWIDGQVVMQKLHISPRTLQTLRSNGTIPYTKMPQDLVSPPGHRKSPPHQLHNVQHT